MLEKMAATKGKRKGGMDLVTTFLFVAITAVIVVYVVFATVFPNTVEGVKELFRQHGDRDMVALEAVIQGCKVWWKSGNLLDVTMPDGLPNDFDNSGLNEESTRPNSVEPMPICNREKVKKIVEANPAYQGLPQDQRDQASAREFHLQCIDKCTAVIELYEACGEQVYPPSSDCYKTGDFTMSLRADYAKPNSMVRQAVEGNC